VVILGKRYNIGDVYDDSVRMLNKYINCASGVKYLTENGFRCIDFLYDLDILAVTCCFSLNYGNFSLRMDSFDHLLPREHMRGRSWES